MTRFKTAQALKPEQRLFWLDIETGGLDVKNDPIFEIAFAVTDLNLVVLDSKSWLIWDTPQQRWFDHGKRLRTLGDSVNKSKTEESHLFVLDMHLRNDLLVDAQERGLKWGDARHDIKKWLSQFGIQKTEPICGSSVQFDRWFMQSQMGGVLDSFSYRNIDVSSIKESCRYFNPHMFVHLDRDLKKPERHRAEEDITYSIAEYGWYLDNFLWVGEIDYGDGEASDKEEKFTETWKQEELPF